MTYTYTWMCDTFGCLWQASSENRDQANYWSAEHEHETGHHTTIFIEVNP